MANCVECGKNLGFLNTGAANELKVKNYLSQGYAIPTPLCAECGEKRFQAIQDSVIASAKEKKTAEERQIVIPNITVATVPILPTFEFEVVGIASAQVAFGTGPLNQVFASFSDFFGVESESYSQKLRTAEDACLAKLKIRAGEMGADAVIGMQATYTELTSGHGMLLVCMTGTAVKKIAGHDTRPAP